MAKRFFSKHALNIFSLELEKWEFPLHNHNFYELIFIQNGSGLHSVNGVSMDYNERDIFLLTPRDEHSFEIKEKTTFIFVKFTEQLFIEKTESSIKGKWQRKIDSVLCNPNSSPGSVVSEVEEKKKVFAMLELLRVEYDKRDFFSRQITLDLFGALLTTIVRSINNENPFISEKKVDAMSCINQILGYIRQHIFEKEELTIDSLAQRFHYSHNYIGIFIKKHTGLSLREIILETKIKTAERLLKSSEFSSKEIAAKLCFNDSSHFSKTFKRLKGVTPNQFRKTKP